MARPACLACTDFANEYADLSAGGLGSPAGYTPAAAHSGGSRLYGDALSLGYLEERAAGSLREAREREAGMIDQVLAFSQWKRQRATGGAESWA